jgi:hypothetical protein
MIVRSQKRVSYKTHSAISMTPAADLPAARLLPNRHEAVPASTATQIWPNVKDQVAKAREEAGEVQWNLGRHSELRRQGSVTKASHFRGWHLATSSSQHGPQTDTT